MKTNEKIQHKVGERFEMHKIIYQVYRDNHCKGCSLYIPSEQFCADAYKNEFEPCCSFLRQDETDVIFVKVGEVKT